MQYLTTDVELHSFVERSLSSSILAIDTEFIREKTYHPRLCLLQLGTDEEVVLVDPFKLKDLTPLVQLLERESIVKLVHSGRQDIEILYTVLGCMPWPLFDTQIAASVLGYPQQIGYGPLVQAECGVSLSKKDSYTDWMRRPLSASQLRYAADDVVYLPEVYRKLKERLEKSGRTGWVETEFRNLVDPSRYDPAPRERWRRLKKVGQMSRKQLSAAREIAAWREERAEKMDIPRRWVITDEQIVEACKRETRTIDELFMIRGVREKLGTSEARTVVKLMQKGLDAPKDTWPSLEKPRRNERNVDMEVDLMTALVRKKSKESGIAFQTLSSHEALQAIARGHYEESELLEGWKYDIVGKDLLDLAEGRIALAMENGRLRVLPLG